jgi:hypothetical protein
MMLMDPFRMVFFPPVAIMPMMVFIPIAVPSPFRVMPSDPIRMMLEPPATGVPLMMRVVVTPAMLMLVGVHKSRHSREESCYHRTRHKCSPFHTCTS